MNEQRRKMWIKELYEFNKKTEEEISVMLDIDLAEVQSCIAELNGGGVIMNTDKITPDTPVETEEEQKVEKVSNRDKVKRLYLEDNKDYEEISQELGLSPSTVKLYISQGGYSRNPRRKRNRSPHKQAEDETVTDEEHQPKKEIENIEKPYEDIGDGYVIYNGRVMKKMTKEEFVRYMMAEQNKRKMNNQ